MEERICLSRNPSKYRCVILTLSCPKKWFCGVKLWQRSYHEHVIRNEHDYREIWEYIENDPEKRAEDRHHAE